MTKSVESAPLAVGKERNCKLVFWQLFLSLQVFLSCHNELLQKVAPTVLLNVAQLKIKLCGWRRRNVWTARTTLLYWRDTFWQNRSMNVEQVSLTWPKSVHYQWLQNSYLGYKVLSFISPFIHSPYHRRWHKAGALQAHSLAAVYNSCSSNGLNLTCQIYLFFNILNYLMSPPIFLLF